MTTNIGEEVNTEADLSQLRPFLAKQHDSFIEMLQEPIDNGISSIIRDETYFDNPEPLKIQVTIKRHENLVEIIVADHGPGITRENIRDHIFSTADTSTSEGILNNMGAGLKASLCWCEISLEESEGVSPLDNPFRLYTKPEGGDSIYYVEGPVTGDLRVYEASRREFWEEGASELPTQDHGTRVHMICARSDFDDDVWPRASRIRTKLQFIRENLGVRFQRLLEHDEAEIIISYTDTESGDSGQLSVEPINPIYNDEFDHGTDEFTVKDKDGVKFKVRYEYGVLDTEALGDEVREIDEGLYVSGNTGPLRWRYRQGNAGVDVYANGRILSIEEWPWESSSRSHNRFNRFHGHITIVPQDPSEQVPTSNDKSDIDRTSRVWREIAKEIRENHSPIETFERSSESSSTSEDDSPDHQSNETSSTDETSDEETSEGEASSESSSNGLPTTASSTNDPSSDSSEASSTQSRSETTSTSTETESPRSDTTSSTGSSNSTTESASTTSDESSEEPSDGESEESEDRTSTGSSSEDSTEDESTEGEEIPEQRSDLLRQVKESLREEEETSQINSDQIEGADIDLVQRTGNGTTLWLVSTEAAGPDAVYDLMMYQDHYKRSNSEDYFRSVIAAPELTEDCESDLERAKNREDEHGDRYQFEFNSLEDILA